MAELSGHGTPDRLQHLLSRAKWDADDIRDDLRGYVVEAFGDPDAGLVVGETGDIKKGTKTVGVQRQYTGTAGRIENCQIAADMTYTSRKGHALIDRALYLPKSWTEDPSRCAEAGVPVDIEFATKPALAAAMINNALDADVPASWVAGEKSTAPIQTCEPCRATGKSAMSLRSAAAGGYPPGSVICGSMSWLACYLPRRGSHCPPALKDHGCTPGCGSQPPRCRRPGRVRG